MEFPTIFAPTPPPIEPVEWNVVSPTPHNSPMIINWNVLEANAEAMFNQQFRQQYEVQVVNDTDSEVTLVNTTYIHMQRVRPSFGPPIIRPPVEGMNPSLFAFRKAWMEVEIRKRQRLYRFCSFYF